MKLFLLALVLVCAFCNTGKYSDLSDSFTNLLLSISSNGNAFSNFQGKLGNLTSNIDSTTASSENVQSSVLDFISLLETAGKWFLWYIFHIDTLYYFTFIRYLQNHNIFKHKIIEIQITDIIDHLMLLKLRDVMNPPIAYGASAVTICDEDCVWGVGLWFWDGVFLSGWTTWEDTAKIPAAPLLPLFLFTVFWLFETDTGLLVVELDGVDWIASRDYLYFCKIVSYIALEF